MTNIQGSVQAWPPRHARGTHKPLSSAQSRAGDQPGREFALNGQDHPQLGFVFGAGGGLVGRKRVQFDTCVHDHEHEKDARARALWAARNEPRPSHEHEHHRDLYRSGADHGISR